MTGIFDDPDIIPGKTLDQGAGWTGHEAPLLFSAPMILALLDGRKTVTRRIVDMKRLRVRLPARVTSDPLPIHIPGYDLSAKPGLYRAHIAEGGAVSIDVRGKWLGVKPGEFHFVCPYAAGPTHLGTYWCPAMGDATGRRAWTITPESSRLWTKETWAPVPWNAGAEVHCPEQDHDEQGVRYRATWDRSHRRSWRPSIFQFRWASRITLDVTSVRIERLQDITDEDARAEGVAPFFERFPSIGRDQRLTTGELVADAPHRASFAVLWDDLNAARGSWKGNPFVWRVAFRVAEVRGRVMA